MESKRIVEAVTIRFDVRGWSKSGVVDQPAEIDWARSKVGDQSRGEGWVRPHLVWGL